MKRRRLEYIYYYFNKDRRAVVRKTAPRPGHRFPSPSGRRRGGGPQHLGGVWAWLGGGRAGEGAVCAPGKGGKRRGNNAERPMVLTGVEALYDGCCINEVPAAEHAHEMGV